MVAANGGVQRSYGGRR